MKFSYIIVLFLLGFLTSVTPVLSEVSEFSLLIEEGEPLTSEKGIFFPRGEDGFLNLRIEDNQFVLIFLNAEKIVIEAENIANVSIIADSVRGDDERENYLLNVSPSGLLYSHPRYIEKPFIYLVKVRVTTTDEFSTPLTATGHDEKETVQQYGFAMLKQ